MSGWQWWAGPDDERFTSGPYATRDEAIAKGWNEGWDDGFYIVEATKGRLRTDVFDDWLGEAIDNCNDEAGDPDGDAISAKITTEQWNEVVADLNKVMKAWADKHNLHAHVWRFENQRNLSFVRRKRDDE